MTRVSKEALARFAQSGAFDSEWYVSAYPDVLASGMDPAEHFLWLGAKLGRSPHAPLSEQRRRLAGQHDAIFIDGTNGTASTTYRVDLIAAGLQSMGWKVGTCRLDQARQRLADTDMAPRCVIIHRAYDHETMQDLVLEFRSKGAIIIYDVDDLIFDLDVLEHVDAYKHMSESHKVSFEKSIKDVIDCILLADACTTSTEFLADRLRKLGKPAYRVRNSISQAIIHDYGSFAVRQKQRPEPFVVGYYSGTKTHQADFAVVAPALIEFMENNKDVIFRLVGRLDLSAFPKLAEWQEANEPGQVPRVVAVSLMPHNAMLRDQLTCDVIIAPLEVGNPFCEAKSELKFFEASLAKRPVIASATQTFVEATEQGRLALLAGKTADWRAALEAIYRDYASALNRADAAFRWVCERYSQSCAAAEAMAAYDDFAAKRARLAGSSRLRSLHRATA
jgi:hypothetical protein